MLSQLRNIPLFAIILATVAHSALAQIVPTSPADEKIKNLSLQKTPDSSPLDEQKSSNDDTALTKNAIKLGKSGQYDRSLTLFQDILQIQKARMARTYNNIGYLHELKGDTAKAIEFYNLAIQLDAKLVESNANLGRLFFTQKNWEKSVQYGEATLRIDPLHSEVKKWLPIAYEKLLEQRKEELLGKKKVTEKKKIKSRSALIQANISTKARTNYSYTDKALLGRKYNGYQQPYPAPLELDLWFFPYERLFIQIRQESPDFGINNPDFLYARQNFSLFYRIGRIHLGTGVLLSELNTRQIRHENEDLVFQYPDTAISDMRTDQKFGFTIAQELRGAQYIIQWYPRLYPRVTKSTGGFTFDYTELSARISRNMPGYRVYMNFLMREVFVYQFNVDLDTNNTIVSGTKTLSHYFGHSDFTIGVDLKLLDRSPRWPFELFFALEAGGRLYLRDVKNDSPFSILNGQGYFGFSPTNFLEGDSFKGYYTNSTLLRFQLLQRFMPELSVRQGLEFEIASQAQNLHGINLILALDYYYF